MYSTILCKKLASGGLHDLCRTSTIVVDALNKNAKSFGRLSTVAAVYANKPSLLRSSESMMATAAYRYYCKDYRPFPEMPEFPPVVWPNLFKSIKALLYTYLVIKPQLDSDFSLGEFAKNSRKVLDGYT